MNQTERDPFSQIGGRGLCGNIFIFVQNSFLRSHKIYAVRVNVVKGQGKVIRTMISILKLGMYSFCIEQE
jgi:hypothetical protein